MVDMTKNSTIFIFTILAFISLSKTTFAFTEIVNREELRLRLGTLSPSKKLAEVKVAILDNGFAGYVPGKGMLPASTELVEGPLRFPTTSAHGLGMAQILWTMTGQLPEGPKFYLVNTNGFTNFKAAIDFVIEKKVDIVLYSQVWLFGSNFDGKGFINEAVNKTTAAGIIWVNAAGNLGGHVHTGKGTATGNTFRVKNKIDENSFSVTLAWNNFGDREQDCAVKDLDLEVLDHSQKVIFSSRLVQSGQAPDPKDPQDPRSCYARESVAVNSLERGDYVVRVTSKGGRTSEADLYKVIINDERPESLEFPDHSVGFEIMPPADNRSVITVGDQSVLSSVGPTIDGRIKPDFTVENSKVSFTNGNLTQGSSNAAAMVAGSLAVMKSLKPKLASKHILNFAQTLREQAGIPNGLITPGQVPQWITKYIPEGGFVRLHPTTGRAIIFSKDSPVEISFIKRFNLRMILPDDIVACNEFLSFCGLYPRSQDAYLAPPLIEFRQANLSTPGVWKNAETILEGASRDY